MIARSKIPPQAPMLCQPASSRTNRAGQSISWPLAVLLSCLAAGCASAPLDEAGSLQSYSDLKPSNGFLASSRLNVSKDDVLAARTVRIVPTTFSTSAERVAFTPEQRALVTNAVDRTLCSGLSERFEVVGSMQPADLTIHAVVTQVKPTDPVAAGVSKGASVAKSVLLPGVPVPVPRIPIGLGSLSLEAEARDAGGKQKAAMLWGRGANAFFGTTRIAEEGDAYTLAAAFGADFSELVVTGESPYDSLPSAPSLESMRVALGGAPKYPACEAFGRAPGLVGFVGGTIGVPPSWTDKGAVTAAD